VRREQVLALDVDAHEPQSLRGARELALGAVAERDEVAQVAHAHVVRLAGGDQQLVRVLAHGLQQPVAARLAVELHERLVHEVGEEIHHRLGPDVAAPGHGLGGLQRPAAREDREARRSTRSGSSSRS
jgi:hypothetical protein